MVETSLNLFDVIVISVLIVSALLSLFRGFLREFLSLGTWIGAGVITLYAFPDVAEWMKTHVQSPVAASGLASIGTFITAFLALAFFTRLLGKYLKTGAEAGSIDNILGFGFGLVRGGLLVVIAYLAIGIMVPKDAPPEWLKTSLTAPYVSRGANWLAALAPDYLSDLMALKDKETGGADAPEMLPLGAEEGAGSWPAEDVLKHTTPPAGEYESPDSDIPETEEESWPTMDELRGAVKSQE
jgi:membrane protein required for colicin V production